LFRAPNKARVKTGNFWTLGIDRQARTKAKIVKFLRLFSRHVCNRQAEKAGFRASIRMAWTQRKGSPPRQI
jgi:hypothetical protein